jgi:hypothetical protein
VLLLVVIALWSCGAAQAQERVEAAAGKRIMRVFVLGEDRQPLVAARLHVAVWAKEPVKGNRDYVTDEHGQAAVSLPEEPRIVRIWARRDGYAPTWAHWWPEHNPDAPPIPDEFTFELLPGTVIGGFVQNDEGEAIEGVKVEVRGEFNAGVGQPTGQPLFDTWLAHGEGAVATDAEGRWTLGNVPGGDDGSVLLKLSHPDYVSDYEWGGLQKEQGLLLDAFRQRTGTIVMRRGVSVTGTVTDPEGKPVPQAVVIWGDDPYLQEGSQEVLTNDAGVYRLPPLPAGPLPVTVVARGWAPERRVVEVARGLGAVDVPLRPGRTVRLRLVDTTGKPVPRGYVSIAVWRGAKSLYTHRHPNVVDLHVPDRADEAGVYEWTWAPEDEVTYTVTGAGQERAVRAGPGEHVVELGGKRL